MTEQGMYVPFSESENSRQTPDTEKGETRLP